jgi:hypothetical protein
MRPGTIRIGKTALRWSIITTCGAIGLHVVYLAATMLWATVLVRMTDSTGLLMVVVSLLLTVGAGCFLRIAYFTFRRRYQEVCDRVSALVGAAIFTALLLFPWPFADLSRRAPFEGRFELPLAIAVLSSPFIGFFVARWVNDRLRMTLLRLVEHDVDPFGGAESRNLLFTECRQPQNLFGHSARTLILASSGAALGFVIGINTGTPLFYVIAGGFLGLAADVFARICD